MYAKLFSKILDSSIWLEADGTRLVWITLLAAMDQDGFAAFASVANLAHRARVPIDTAEAAIRALESPDPDSGNPDHEGRRVERVPGGWIVLNAPLYRNIVKAVESRRLAAERAKNYRERHAPSRSVTPASRKQKQKQKQKQRQTKNSRARESLFDRFWQAYPRKTAKAAAEKAFRILDPDDALLDTMLRALDAQARSQQWQDQDGRFIPYPATWLNRHQWEDEAPPERRPRVGEADYYVDWSEECRDLHNGTCPNRYTHESLKTPISEGLSA